MYVLFDFETGLLEFNVCKQTGLRPSASRSEIPGRFWNVMLKKDLLDRSCEKRRNITWSQEGQKYPTYNKREEG
jgi:hypothetical protein